MNRRSYDVEQHDADARGKARGRVAMPGAFPRAPSLVYSARVRRLKNALAGSCAALVGMAFVGRTASGADAPGTSPSDEAAIAASLNQAPETRKPADRAGGPLETLPPPPHKRGVVLDTTFGAMGFLGKLRTVSPTASMIRIQLGYEPLRFLLLFAASDVAFTSTRYAAPVRGYAIYAFGAGARLTLPLGERVSVYGQVDFGETAASRDVLVVYGFKDADTLSGYFGGAAGIEWYQIDPHYALALNGGIRRAQGFAQLARSDPALAWLGGVALRYTF
jgi:hypothetical protein